MSNDKMIHPIIYSLDAVVEGAQNGDPYFLDQMERYGLTLKPEAPQNHSPSDSAATSAEPATLPEGDYTTPSFCKQNMESSSQCASVTPDVRVAFVPTVELSPTSFPPVVPPQLPQLLRPMPTSRIPVQQESTPILVEDFPKSSTIKATAVERALLSNLSLCLVREIPYVFDGIIYRHLTEEEMHRVIRGNCRQYVEAVGNASIIKQVYELLYTEPGLVLRSTPSDSNFLAFHNGLLNLMDGTFILPTKDLFVTALINSPYFPQEQGNCPNFLNYLASVTGGDELLQQRIWEFLGYTLTPDVNGKCFFLLQGVPNSGKSLLGDFLASCFEDSAVAALDVTAMGMQFGPGELMDKRLCLSMDLSAASWEAKSVGMLKLLTGNDTVSADIKYRSRVKFRNTAKLLFGTNHAVTLAKNDEALLQRLVVIPFRYGVPRECQDKLLGQKFQREKSAIVATAMLAYFQLRSKHYIFSGNYPLNDVSSGNHPIPLDLNQAISQFFHQECTLESEAFTFTFQLHEAFLRCFPIQCEITAFSSRLTAFLDVNCPDCVTKQRKRHAGNANPQNGLLGIRLRNNPPSEAIPEKHI